MFTSYESNNCILYSYLTVYERFALDHLWSHNLRQYMYSGRTLKFPRSVFQSPATDRWFSPDTLVSSTNKTDRHNITKMLLKVALNTMTLTQLCRTE